MNALLWGTSFVLVAAGIAGNYFFMDKPLLIRVIGLISIFAAAIGAASITTHGKQLIKFAFEARTEIRKVFWPSRQETTQTLGIVLAMVVIVGLVLWGIDAILLRLVGWITGYGV